MSTGDSESLQPILETPRLLLRPFRLDDAADVQRLAGAREVADTTVRAGGFGALGLARIHATCFVRNPASARVLAKAGMREEGVRRDIKGRWNRVEDHADFGFSAEEWREGAGGASHRAIPPEE